METRDADDFSTARIERSDTDDPLLEAYDPGTEEDEDLGDDPQKPDVVEDPLTEEPE